MGRVITFFLVMLTATAALRAQTFPYPAVPAELRTPQERGTFLLAHYWDCYDFSDTTLIHRPEITEQGLVNFIDLLPRIDSTAAEQGVEMFSRRAFATDVPQNVRDNMVTLLEHYLYDPNSPMRSDDLYMLFLSRMAVADALTEADREQAAYRLRNLSKNQPGALAADFTYTDRSGTTSTLRATQADGLLMLYFNDPDCENCHAVTRQLAADSLFTDNPRLKVIAVYPDADTELWRKNRQPFPASWTDAYSPGGEIAARQLYFIRATPTIYLLDSQKRVILKDPAPRAVAEYLRTQLSPR